MQGLGLGLDKKVLFTRLPLNLAYFLSKETNISVEIRFQKSMSCPTLSAGSDPWDGRPIECLQDTNN